MSFENTDDDRVDSDDRADSDDFDPAVELHQQLRATEERPIERETGWYLGEAQALAAELANGGLDVDKVGERAATIRDLLDEFETTGDAVADDHVDAARELAARLTAESSDEN